MKLNVYKTNAATSKSYERKLPLVLTYMEVDFRWLRVPEINFRL